jgi:hypothetical protein
MVETYLQLARQADLAEQEAERARMKEDEAYALAEKLRVLPPSPWDDDGGLWFTVAAGCVAALLYIIGLLGLWAGWFGPPTEHSWLIAVSLTVGLGIAYILAVCIYDWLVVRRKPARQPTQVETVLGELKNLSWAADDRARDARQRADQAKLAAIVARFEASRR